MTVLQVAGLSFGYGASKLFEDVTFSLAAGERVALVAPNGAGKSTLLRLVAGELSPDAGAVTVRKGVLVGYYRQSHELSSEGDVLGAFLSGFGEILALRNELTAAQHAAASGAEQDLQRLARLTDAYHAHRGDELERNVTMLAGRLGFSDSDMGRPITSLSGGERGRLLLGVVLAKQPDLLLLDEPTNHLDLDTIDWLQGFLASYRGAVLIVSHDRAFLDGATTATMELGRKSFRVFPVSFSAYETMREAELSREAELFERQEAQVQKTEEFIRKNIAGQKTKQAQSRRKQLEKLDRLERPEDVWSRAERLAFRFVPAPRTGDIVLDAKGLGATRGGRRLFSGFDLLVRRGDRIGIIGPNGAGKSTLLKLLGGLSGESASAASAEGCEDVGTVRRGTNLAEGYFDQHLGSLVDSRTPVEEIRSVKGDLNVDAARQYLARFRFYGDDTLRSVSGMSGGERSRLSLAKLLLEPRNLLFLDEPTNHLDIPAGEILEEALSGFDGTVVLVSHDRRFLENVTTRTVIVRDGRAEVYPGGFRDYEDHREQAARAEREAAAAEREAKAKERAAKDAKDARDAKGGPEKSGKASFEAEKAAARALERKRRRLVELEDAIARTESELSTMREALRAAPGDDWETLAQKAKEEQALSRKVETMMSEWSTLGEELARAGGPRS